MIDSSRLKNFAQEARRQLMDEISVKLDLALNPASTLAMENRDAVAKLKAEIDSKYRTKEEIIEEVVYTWFNRIIALRYMDSRGLQNPMAVTPLEGQSLPEMLTIAKSLDFSVEILRVPMPRRKSTEFSFFPSVTNVPLICQKFLNGSATILKFYFQTTYYQTTLC